MPSIFAIYALQTQHSLRQLQPIYADVPPKAVPICNDSIGSRQNLTYAEGYLPHLLSHFFHPILPSTLSHRLMIYRLVPLKSFFPLVSQFTPVHLEPFIGWNYVSHSFVANNSGCLLS
jgi:hypothetical protein